MKRESTFDTDHLYLAAFLVCHGHKLISVVAGQSGRFRFGFPDTSEVRSSAGDFMAGGLVDARQFSFELLNLKKNIPRQTDTSKVRKFENAVLQPSIERKT